MRDLPVTTGPVLSPPTVFSNGFFKSFPLTIFAWSWTNRLAVEFWVFFSGFFSRFESFWAYQKWKFRKNKHSGSSGAFFIEKGELYRTRDFTSVTSLDFEPCLISLSLIEVGHNSGVGPRVTLIGYKEEHNFFRSQVITIHFFSYYFI